MASILSFARRKPTSTPLASKLPWQNQDLAELYRVRDRLAASGLAVDVDSGVSDEGDPWFVYQQSGTDNVVVHIARIDTQIHVINCVTNSVYVGLSFREVADRMLEDAPLAVGSELKRSSNVVLHPSAFLTAFVAAAVMLVDLIEHNRAEAAEPVGDPDPAGEGETLFGSDTAPDNGDKPNEPSLKADDADGLPRRLQRDGLASQSSSNVAQNSPVQGHSSSHGFSLIDATTGAVGVSLFAVELLRMINADRADSADQPGHRPAPDMGEDVSVASTEFQASSLVQMAAQQIVVTDHHTLNSNQPSHEDVGRLAIEMSASDNDDGAQHLDPATDMGGDTVLIKYETWVGDTLPQRGAKAPDENTAAATPPPDGSAEQSTKHHAVETLKIDAPANSTTSAPAASPSYTVAKPQDTTVDFNKIIVQLLGGDNKTSANQDIVETIKSAMTIPNITEAAPKEASKEASIVNIDRPFETYVPEFRAGITDVLNYKPGEEIQVSGFVLGEDVLSFTEMDQAYKYVTNFAIDGNDIVLGNAEHGELRLVGVLTESVLAAAEPAALAS